MSGGWFETLHLQTRCGTESLFSPVPGPGTVDSQGQIEFLRCYATLKTKSQTKFYLEFHSSCLESTCLLNCLLGGQARLFHKSLVIDGAFLRSLGKTTDQPQRGGAVTEWGCRWTVQGDTQLLQGPPVSRDTAAPAPERVSHWCTDPSAPCRQLGSWTLSLPLRAEFSPLEGPPSRGSNSTRGSCAKVQSLWKPALGPERLLVIACSCPGSSALCYITGILLRWSEHPKAN